MFSFLWKKTRLADLIVTADATVEGRVVSRRELNVPGTTHRCVWYECVVDAFTRGSRGAGRKMWIPEGIDSRGDDFIVEEAGGRVLVAPGDVRLEVSGGRTVAGPLDQKGTRRYVARILESGARVRVRGAVTAARGAEPGELLVIRPDARGRLRVVVL